MENRTFSFYVLIDPEKEFVQAPGIFFKNFKGQIPRRVWFIDEVGTKIGIIFSEYGDKGYFTLGVWNILTHYNLPHGAWLLLKYSGDGKFMMRVKDINLREVVYPTPPIFIDFDLQFLPEEMGGLSYFSDPVELQLIRRCEIVLTESQTKQNKMELPSKFVLDMFMMKPRQVTIQDEKGRNFTCGVQWGEIPGEASLIGEWLKFCGENNLKGGSKIQLVADSEDGDKINAHIINL